VGLACDGADAASLACLAASCTAGAAYEADGVLSNTLLIIGVTGPDLAATYTFAAITDAQLNDGVASVDVLAATSALYREIGQLAGVTIEGSLDLEDGAGRGVLLGIARDCSGLAIANAYVRASSSDDAVGLTFLGDDTASSDDLTGLSGLFAFANIAPGPVTVTLGGSSGTCSGPECPCEVVGTTEAVTYADAVTVVSLLR
jgi:hypothetical protein